MSDTLYIAEPGDNEEFSFAGFVARLGVSAGSPATFFCRPEGNLESAWNIWQQEWLIPVLGPSFSETYRLGMNSRVLEICDQDNALDQQFSDSMRTRSQDAGRLFLEGKTEMQGHREWKKFADKVFAKESPGHVTTVFALHTVLYRLPLLPALSAYCWFEFRCGSSPKGKMDENWGIDIFNSVLPHLAVAASGINNDYNDGPGTLRAI